ncbi:MAG: hypothetical protein GQ582_08930 [Methyloprofundus sp.]|nr:hypothetical protein [Methyloprofundus sp.]
MKNNGKKNYINDESSSSLAIRVYTYFLIGSVLTTFVLYSVLTGSLKGWGNWQLVYLSPFTWLLLSSSVQVSLHLTLFTLKKKSYACSNQELSNLGVISKALGIIFMCLMIACFLNYL